MSTASAAKSSASWAARFCRMLIWGYAEITYREFDHVYTLSEEARAALARRTVTRTSVLPLGVDTDALLDPPAAIRPIAPSSG